MATITQVTPTLVGTVAGAVNVPIESHLGIRPRVGDQILAGRVGTTWHGVELLTGEIPPDRVYFNRAAPGTPAHFASVAPDGTGFAAEAWSIDPLYHSWWFKVSPNRRRVLFCRTAVADVAGLAYHDYSKLQIWIANADGSNLRRVCDKPANLINPDASVPTFQGTPNWIDDDTFIMFRGAIRAGGANAIIKLDIDGNLVDIIADVTGVSFTDTQVGRVADALNAPLALAGVDSNVKLLTSVTTVNGSNTVTINSGSVTAADVGRFVLGPGILPGAYIATQAGNSFTMSMLNDAVSPMAAIAANANAAAGTGGCFVYGAEASSVTTTGWEYRGGLRVFSAVGAIQQIFSFPLAQTYEDGVGTLPKGFYKFTTNTASEILDYDPNPNPTGTRLFGLARLDGATLTAGIDNVTTTIPITDRTMYPVGATLLIGAEKLTVTASGAGAGNLTATRAAGGTAAAAHLINDHVYLAPAGVYAVTCARMDDGTSGSGTKPKTLIGMTTTDRGAPDIVDAPGNYTSKAHISPHRQANGTVGVVAHRYVDSPTSARAFDVGASAPYVGIVAFDYNERTHTASNPRTLWRDNFISEFPYWS